MALSRVTISVLSLLLVLSQFVLAGCNPNGYGTDIDKNISYSELLQKLNSIGTKAEESTETLNESMFSVPGRITLISNQRIQIFQYETSSAAKSKAQTISPQGDKVGSGIVDWIGIPNFYFTDLAI